MTIVLTLLSGVSYRGQEITAPRLRDLLALLAGDLRTGCSTARLVEGLWPDEQPENPSKALQILVSRVRTQLGSDLIARTPSGYRLTLGEDEVDASAVLVRAAASARHSRAGDHTAALAEAEGGLALWKGPAGDDIERADPVSALRAERASTYRSLARGRAVALSRLGRHAEAIDELTDLARERPRDEEILLELLRSEADTCGPSAALARYEAYRRSLRDDLGSDPGPALQAEHQRLLQDATPKVRHGVLHDPNPLLGRDDDIAAVADLLRTARVTSIVGTGGLGKTRLAHVVSRRAEQRVVHFVPLTGVTTEDDVAAEVASVLGVGESLRTQAGHRGAPTDALAAVVDMLGPGPALLVLDNCEHVLRGVADLVHALVSTTRDVRVLTTGRAPLGLSSESVYLLPELTLRTAVELFEQRARAARPGADLPAGEVEELCGHLDGLPLAVELAAAQVRVMSVAEIARRLDDRFAVLRGGPRDAPRRHRTLQAVVKWSWNLLEPAGQSAMRALSVFPGGFTTDAATHLLGDGDVLLVLEQLVDQSLLQVADTPVGTRFRMLETVREFSAARREEAGETDGVVGAFLGWARDFGLSHHDSPLGADPFPALERIRAEQDNLVLAFRHGLARTDGATVAATAAVLAGLWTIESNYPRMATLVEQAESLLSHFRPGPELVEATRTALTLYTIRTFAMEGPRAVRSLVALRRLPPAPPTTVARAAAIVLGAAREARSAVFAMCESDEPLLAGVANGVASYLWDSDGDPDNARQAAHRMIEAFEGQTWMQIFAHSRIGELCLLAEQGEEAERHLRAALRLLGPWPDVIGIGWGLVLAHLQRGAVDEAEHWLERARARWSDQAISSVTFGLGAQAEIMLARGYVEAGLRLWRQAVEGLEDPGTPGIEPGLEAWAAQLKAITVTAHAYHGRLDLVTDLVDELPHTLRAVLTDPAVTAPAYLMGFALGGTLLLALGMAHLDRGEHASGARMIALAERFRFLREFHPTMSSARASRAAEQADQTAYEDAMSSYADLDREDLRNAALTVLQARSG